MRTAPSLHLLLGLTASPYFCQAQMDGERDFSNFFTEPPAADSKLNSRPGVFENNKIYPENVPVNVQWYTVEDLVDIALVKEDNGTGLDLFQIICTLVSVPYCYWNGIIPDRLKSTYVWPNNVYFFSAWVPGEPIGFMTSHYFNITNATANVNSSLSSISAASATTISAISSAQSSDSSMTSTAVSSNVSGVASSTSRTALAGGLGGGLGGLAVLVAVIATWSCIIKRRRTTASHIDCTQHEHQPLPVSQYLRGSFTNDEKQSVSNVGSTSRFSELPGSQL